MKAFTPYFLLIMSFNVMAEIDISAEIKQLIVSGKNPFFVNVGEKTQSILTERSGSISSCAITLKAGDVPEPIGDGKAEMYAVISCEGHTTIGLRLKRANIIQYHILGYWTLNGFTKRFSQP